jgi:KaiC/GvpD/RAD55 family RecA-like ATPase
VCCLYETEEEYRASVIPFLRLGLERNERVIYSVDAHTAESVKHYLQAEGIDVARFLSRGQLLILSASPTQRKGVQGHVSAK